MTPISKNFYLEEFVPKSFVKRFGRNSSYYVSDWQVETAEFVRDYFGGNATVINNWPFGGKNHNRGTRSPYSRVGSSYSMHKFMRAIDFSIRGINVVDIYEEILKNQSEFLKRGITTIEDVRFTSSWIHLDGRRIWSEKKMLVVAPRVVRALNHEEDDFEKLEIKNPYELGEWKGKAA